MLQSTGKKKIFLFYIIIFIFLSTQITKNYKGKKNSIIRIKNIEVIGLSEKNNYQISEELKPLLFHNILFVKKEVFEQILKKNNLIESFNIKKFYPNLIKVRIRKTSFLAITHNDSNKYYIGSNGKLIPFKELDSFYNNLPFVFSKNNYENFIKLKNIIDQSEFSFEEIDSFYYFPSNRWDIKTKNGLLIKLPEKNILQSLRTAYIIQKNENFKNKTIIDLRITNQIITNNE